MRYKTHMFFLFFMLTFCHSHGQENQQENQSLKFKHFSLTEGLSQSSVLCMLQDKKGFLWFGTRDGLNKYDGHEFKTYRYNPQDTNSLSNSYIRSLFEDENGNLWVGTINGLNKFIPDEEQFKRFRQTDIDNSISTNEIWAITSQGDGYLWVGTNFGLKKFNVQKGVATHFLEQNSTFKEISKNPIRSILIAKDGNVWICNTDNIDVFCPKTQKYQHYAYPQGSFKERKLKYAPVLYEDRDDNLWLGYLNGLLLFNKALNVFEPYNIESTGISKITDEVRSIHQDYLGNIWVGTYEGLYVIKSDKSSISHHIHDENERNSLSHNSIYKIFEDSKGDIWIGTYAGGVNYYDRNFDLFKHYVAGTNNSKLNYKVVSSIVEDPNRNLWIATEGGGINFLNRSTGQFDYITHDEKNPNSLSADNVKSMIRTQNGDFWIGTHDNGLNFLNPDIRPYTFKKYKYIPNDTSSLSNNRVISLFEDYRKNIWIGTSGGGLNILDVSTQSIKRLDDPFNHIGKIVNNISKTSSKDTLLIGGDRGLVKINVKTHQIVPVKYIEREQYSTSAVLCAYEDTLQNIWIATEGNGLYYYHYDSKKSIRYGMQDGMPNEVIYSILPDDFNNIWLSTNKGLSRLNLSTYQFKNFDVSDGLLSNEFNYRAFLKLKNGNLMFGGISGIDFFNPDNIEENSFVPPVSVTSILVNNKPFLPKNNANKEITLKHSQNVFSFSFVALSYSQPNKNQYAYKLEGFDTDWNYIGNKKSATYTNLESGEYLFKVKASNNDGLWNEIGEAVVVNILPPPWKTWWAYLIYSIVLVIILLLIRKYTLIRIHEKNQLKHERIEKERIKEINKMKLRFFTNISHDFRTPLTLIIGPLERMLSINAGNDFIQKQHEIMYKNASVLLQLINQLLDFRKNESGKLQLKACKNNVVPIIEDIKLTFEELAQAKQINYTFSASSDHIDVWVDKINLKKIILNLLSNAFKFTPDKGEISILISTTDQKTRNESHAQYLKIEIRDNGIGIPEKEIDFVFERFYQSGKGESWQSGTGIGLSLTKSLVELHHGTIEVKSIEGEGTSFIVLLPLGKNHLSENEILKENTDNKDNASIYFEQFNYLVKEQIKEKPDKEAIIIDATKPTLLLVEDNLELRSFIKNIFQKDNNILEAENGKIGLEFAQNNRVDLIISDVMMPLMDGIELCEKIKTNILTSHIPIVLLTAKTSEESKKTGYTTGADVYITKPFDPNILMLRVQNLLITRKNLIEKFKKDIILEPKELKNSCVDELFLQKAISLIEDNMSNPDFTLKVFISGLGMSRSTLYRKLKALTGLSITEFIRTIKLKRAAQLISQTQLNISEIAFDLGFNDIKHFRKSFKALFKMTPSEYRENN